MSIDLFRGQWCRWRRESRPLADFAGRKHPGGMTQVEGC